MGAARGHADAEPGETERAGECGEGTPRTQFSEHRHHRRIRGRFMIIFGS
jgi:hypothetical protein